MVILFSQAVQVGDTVYVSGVLGLDKDTMKLVPGGVEQEVTRALQNLGAVLEAANSSYSKGNVLLHCIKNIFVCCFELLKIYYIYYSFIFVNY